MALAAVAAYCNSFAVPFLLDDPVWIVSNTSIRHLWPIGDVLYPPHEPLVRGRPMVSLTLAINYALGGTNVWGYHADEPRHSCLGELDALRRCATNALVAQASESDSTRPPLPWP